MISYSLGSVTEISMGMRVVLTVPVGKVMMASGPGMATSTSSDQNHSDQAPAWFSARTPM